MSDIANKDTGSAPLPQGFGGALLSVLAIAGFAGAGGVALAAVAAHKVDSPALATAATMLMIHATAGIAVLAVALHVRGSGTGWNGPCPWIGVAAAMLGAVLLFSGDIALNTLAGTHIFPKAAPIGGSLLIASWVALALLSVWTALRAR